MKLKYYTVLLAFAGLSTINTGFAQDTATCGLIPPLTQLETFGNANTIPNYENFAPTYAGPIVATEIDPQLSVNTLTPIAPGQTSIQWSANTVANKWFIVSNAFYTGMPVNNYSAYTVSVDVVIDPAFLTGANPTEVGLLGAVKSYTRGSSGRGTFSSSVDALRLRYTQTGSSVILSTNANSSNWPTTSTQQAITLTSDTIYTLQMAYNTTGGVTAKVFANKLANPTAPAIATLSSTSSVSKTQTTAVGMLVDIPAFASTTSPMPTINYGNFTVTAPATPPYQVTVNQWQRAPFPYFVTIGRQGNVAEAPGDWVGAASVIYNANATPPYKIWYRERDNADRGFGYGYATSQDGLTWTKYFPAEGSSVFIPTTPNQSIEKISVHQKPDGTYIAWYSLLNNGGTGNDWRVAYATSPDGITWTDQGYFNTGSAGGGSQNYYYKDPYVIQVNGTYYMYVISDGNQTINPGEEAIVLISTDGINWTTNSTSKPITNPTFLWSNYHMHPSVYYAQNSAKFWLYQDNPTMKEAYSISPFSGFGFQTVLSPSAAGLDDDTIDAVGTGVNYATFLADGNGQIPTDQHVIMYYQARHAELNFPSSWTNAQDGRVVMAGKFNAFYLNLPMQLLASNKNGSLTKSATYSAFPYNCSIANGISSVILNPARNKSISTSMNVTSWDNTSAASGGTFALTSTGNASPATFLFVNLLPSTTYKFTVGSSCTSQTTGRNATTLSFTTTLPISTINASLAKGGCS